MSAPPHILIADADPARVQPIQRGLIAQGYQVTVAARVPPATAPAAAFNVALVSAELPADDLTAWLAALRASRLGEPALIWTTNRPALATAQARHAQAIAYLAKPLTHYQAQLVQRLHELQALAQVAQAITSTLDPTQILDLIVQRVKEVMGGEAVSLLMVDPAQGDLVFHVVSGGRERGIRPFRLQVGEGIAGWVAQQGQPLFVPDVRQDPRHYGQVDESTGFVTRSILCAPMIVKDRVIGVIEVMNKISGEFDEEDLQLLSSAALLSAAAIENARLFQRTPELATTDGLTGLYNYRHFHYLLQNEIDRAQRYHRPLTLLIIDPDHFQEINDTYGHPGGPGSRATTARASIALAR